MRISRMGCCKRPPDMEDSGLQHSEYKARLQGRRQSGLPPLTTVGFLYGHRALSASPTSLWMLARAEDIEVFMHVCVMLIHQQAAWERETGKLFRVLPALRCGCCCRFPPSPLSSPAIGHFQHCHVSENTYEEKPECEMEKSSRGLRPISCTLWQ